MSNTNDWKQMVANALTSGVPMTNDQLEEALHGALVENKELRVEVERVTAERDQDRDKKVEMSLWLGKIAAAFLKRDVDSLTATIGEYTMRHVKLVKVVPGAKIKRMT